MKRLHFCCCCLTAWICSISGTFVHIILCSIVPGFLCIEIFHSNLHRYLQNQYFFSLLESILRHHNNFLEHIFISTWITLYFYLLKLCMNLLAPYSVIIKGTQGQKLQGRLLSRRVTRHALLIQDLNSLQIGWGIHTWFSHSSAWRAHWSIAACWMLGVATKLQKRDPGQALSSVSHVCFMDNSGR